MLMAFDTVVTVLHVHGIGYRQGDPFPGRASGGESGEAADFRFGMLKELFIEIRPFTSVFDESQSSPFLDRSTPALAACML